MVPASDRRSSFSLQSSRRIHRALPHASRHAAPPTRPHAIIDWRCSREIPQFYYVLHMHAATKHTCMLTGPGSLILMTLAARSFALTVLVRARADFLPCKGSMLRYDQAMGAMCFLWSFARLTCLSFASQQQYVALLPCMVEEHRQARASSRCTACPSGFSGLLQHTGLPV